MRYGPGGVQQNSSNDFWQKVAIGGLDECWFWLEGLWGKGYGRFKRAGRSLRAHRFALEQVRGAPPAPYYMALHSCHNPSCCNPVHLRWGTHQENIDDRTERFALARRQLSVEEYEKSWGHERSEA